MPGPPLPTAPAASQCHPLTSGEATWAPFPHVAGASNEQRGPPGCAKGLGGAGPCARGSPVPHPCRVPTPGLGKRQMMLLRLPTSSAHFFTTSCESSGGGRRWRSSGDATAAELALRALRHPRAPCVPCTRIWVSPSERRLTLQKPRRLLLGQKTKAQPERPTGT